MFSEGEVVRGGSARSLGSDRGDVVLSVSDLGKCYSIYREPHHRLLQGLFRGRRRFYEEFWALRGVSIAIGRGETVGIVGRNGSGKSTLLQLIAGTLAPTTGAVSAKGRITALLELGAGFNMEFTGRENIYMYGAILGLPREEVDRRFDEIAAFADIGEFIDRPMKTYSSGMIVRLAFAVSACVDPDILIVDEALAVGDAAFQRKCFRHLEGIIARGAVVLFVSHDVESVKRFCQRAIWLADGQVRQIGSAKAVCEAYERFLLGHDPADAREPAESAAAVPAPAPPAAALLDPNLVIAAPVQYGGYAAVIEQLWITDGAGKTVNVVPEVIDFTVNYRIRFKEACRKVWFGMTVKTVDGIAVYAAHTVDRHAPSDFHAGEAVHIRFALKNGLAPGTYFLNCGANHETPRGRDVLHRLLDATILRVSSEPGPLRYGGIANLKAQVSIERVEPTP